MSAGGGSKSRPGPGGRRHCPARDAPRWNETGRGRRRFDSGRPLLATTGYAPRSRVSSRAHTRGLLAIAAVASLAADHSCLAALDPDFDPRLYLLEQTRAVGRCAGCEHAVAFEVVTL
jgi:hypothetical protein